MEVMGRFLVIAGVFLVLAGIMLILAPRVPSLFGWLGHLPGDIHIQRENFSFHFPLMTCLLLSAALSFILWLASRVF